MRSRTGGMDDQVRALQRRLDRRFVVDVDRCKCSALQLGPCGHGAVVATAAAAGQRDAAAQGGLDGGGGGGADAAGAADDDDVLGGCLLCV